MARTRIVVLLLIFLGLQRADAQSFQNSAAGDSIILAAHPDFQAGWLHTFFFGSLWRDIWTTPVRAEVVHPGDSLNTTETFIPFYQDSFRTLPAELEVLLPVNIVNDQMCMINPFAPLVISPMLEAVHLPFRKGRLSALIITDTSDWENGKINARLGIMQGPWLNIPFDRQDSVSNRIINTQHMLDSLEKDHQAYIDELQYLKARLIDILLGDWERSEDQWLWFSIRKNGRTCWRPVPLNHHQAFVRLNGLLPSVAHLAIPQLANCGDNISSVEHLTLTGQTLDRRILVSYTKQVWDSMATWIQGALTDSVFMEGLHQLPSNIYAKEGKNLFHLLQSRRSQLPKAAEKFYSSASSCVEIHGSNESEYAEIRRMGKHIVALKIYNHTDFSKAPIYHRLFYDDYTEEVRVLLLGGHDTIALEGDESGTIKVIIDGSIGEYELFDKTKVRSRLASFNPFAFNGTTIYTSNPEIRIPAGRDIHIANDPTEIMHGQQNIRAQHFHRDWGTEWSFDPWFNINPDDGFFIGGGPIWTRYAYRMDPYAEQISMRAGIASRTGRYRFDATGEFRDWFHGVRTFLQIHASQLDLSNYFGRGNETTYNQSRDDAGFYDIDQRQIFFRASLDFSLQHGLSASVGSMLQLIDNNPHDGTLLDSLKPALYNRSLTFLSINARIQIDTRTTSDLSAKRVFFSVEPSFVPSFFDNEHPFYKIRSEFRASAPIHDIPATTIAFKVAGEKLWGKYPFFESAFLGGSQSLRGFERQRFSGNASVLGGIEIRSQVAQIPFLVPLWAGISVFTESGRVFLSGERSDRWHASIGGGLWFSIIKSEYIVNFSLAHSEDKIAFYATVGFMF
jgi:hypothetical protein